MDIETITIREHIIPSNTNQRTRGFYCDEYYNEAIEMFPYYCVTNYVEIAFILQYCSANTRLFEWR